MRRYLFIVLVALAALALQPAATFAAVEPGQVLPDTGSAGTRFVFIANGFAPNEKLSSWANTPDGRVIEYDTGVLDNALSDGSVTWNWLAPEGIQPGAWQFVVHGLSSSNERVFSFAIGAAAAAPAAPVSPAGVQPPAGTPGTLFTFYATGFTEGEGVSTEVRAPSGDTTTHGLHIDGVAHAGGRVDGSWTSPSDTSEYGMWQIMLRGHDSGAITTISVTIQPANAQPAPAPRVSPQVGRPGMKFLFDVGGFKPGEQVSAWVNTPTGDILPIDTRDIRPTGPDISLDFTWRAADDGTVDFGWTAPENAAVGTWSMVVHGLASGAEQVAAFQIIAAQ